MIKNNSFFAKSNCLATTTPSSSTKRCNTVIHHHHHAHRASKRLDHTKVAASQFGTDEEVTMMKFSAPTIVEEAILGATGPEAASAQTLSARGPISWTKQWYPIAVTAFLDPSKPNAVQLLGKNLVLWNSLGEWRCFEDRCPHRAAPLSEGKIWNEEGPEEGTLMCSYHGWKFDSAGDCVRVPQAASADAEKKACSNKRSCATAYPVALAQGLLFVWGEAEGFEESGVTPLPVDTYLEGALERGDPVTYIMPPYQRDLPYDMQTLVENVVDPAHVPFSHHKVQGNRDKVNYGDYEMMMVPDEEKLKVKYKGVFGDGFVSFTPPSTVNIYIDREDAYSSFRIYCIPTKPGHSRIVSFMTTNRKKLPAIFKLIKKLPLWVDHVLFRSPVLDGDNVFLHFQEQFLVEKAREKEAETGVQNDTAGAAAASSTWRKNYFMATRADALVAAYKNWLDTCGSGGPYGPLHKAKGYGPLITDHRVLLNRFEQHTKTCSACRGALIWVERFRAVAAAVAAVGFGAALCAAMQAGGAAGVGFKVLATKGVASGALLGFVAAFLWNWLNTMVQKFYFVDYDHAVR